MPADHTALIALGERLGEQAWVWFLLLLPTVVVWVGLFGWAYEHLMRKHAARPEPNTRILFVGLVAGLIAVSALAKLFSQIAAGLGNGTPMAVLDEALSRSVGIHTPAAMYGTLALLTHLSDPWFVVLVTILVAVALWREGHRGFAAGWLMAIVGNALLNQSLKLVFARTRPVLDAGLEQVSGYSFPSGHSSGSVVLYGMLGYLSLRLLPPRWRVPALMAAAMAVVTVACSRIFLRAHFTTDVFAGLCSGSAWLAICIASIECARHRQGLRQLRA